MCETPFFLPATYKMFILGPISQLRKRRHTEVKQLPKAQLGVKLTWRGPTPRTLLPTMWPFSRGSSLHNLEIQGPGSKGPKALTQQG